MKKKKIMKKKNKIKNLIKIKIMKKKKNIKVVKMY